MANTKWVLHYGAQTFDVPDGKALDGLPGSDGLQVLHVAQTSGRDLVLAVGPGIPICLEEKKVGSIASVR